MYIYTRVCVCVCVCLYIYIIVREWLPVPGKQCKQSVFDLTCLILGREVTFILNNMLCICVFIFKMSYRRKTRYILYNSNILNMKNNIITIILPMDIIRTAAIPTLYILSLLKKNIIQLFQTYIMF